MLIDLKSKNVETQPPLEKEWVSFKYVRESISDDQRGIYRFVPITMGEVFHIEDFHRLVLRFVGTSNFMAEDTNIIVQLAQDKIGYSCHARLIVSRPQSEMETEITLRTVSRRVSSQRAKNVKNYYRCIASAH